MIDKINQFTRLNYLLSKEQFEKIQNATVCIVGLGGVGGTACLALARCGVRKFVLCDNDTINITNLNRQVISNLNNIDELKTIAYKKLIESINKDVSIITLNNKFDNNSELFNYQFDYLIDCIDDTENKFLLIKECLKRDIKFISSMGTAKKMDMTKLKIVDINKTEYDPLAKIIRKKLRAENIKAKFMVVSSTEEVSKGALLGSYMPVTSLSGLMICDYIIKEIIK